MPAALKSCPFPCEWDQLLVSACTLNLVCAAVQSQRYGKIGPQTFSLDFKCAEGYTIHLFSQLDAFPSDSTPGEVPVERYSSFWHVIDDALLDMK